MKTSNELSLFAPRSFESLMKPFFNDSLFSSSLSSQFSAKLDMEERETDYLLSLDLPGMGKEDVSIEVKNDHLIIEGERKTEKKEDGYFERQSGSFKRVLPLGKNIDQDNISASFEKGVLSVIVPKQEKSEETNKIEIEEKGE